VWRTWTTTRLAASRMIYLTLYGRPSSVKVAVSRRPRVVKSINVPIRSGTTRRYAAAFWRSSYTHCSTALLLTEMSTRSRRGTGIGTRRYLSGIPWRITACRTCASRARDVSGVLATLRRNDRQGVDDLDLSATACGFPWHPMPKLEHQLVNIRHIQHHQRRLAASGGGRQGRLGRA
jgi:hypothetical protein